MKYNKKENTVQTTRVNSIFREIPLQTRVLEENKKGNQLSDCLFGSKVETAAADANLLSQDIKQIIYFKGNV
jgi:hypothetical protein